jgi:hypothetical protein
VPYVGLYFDMKGYILVTSDGWGDQAGLCLPNLVGGTPTGRAYIPSSIGARRLFVNDKEISNLLDRQLVIDWIEPPIYEWVNRAAGYRNYYFFNPLIPVRVFGKMFYAIALERGKPKPFHIDFFVYLAIIYHYDQLETRDGDRSKVKTEFIAKTFEVNLDNEDAFRPFVYPYHNNEKVWQFWFDLRYSFSRFNEVYFAPFLAGDDALMTDTVITLDNTDLSDPPDRGAWCFNPFVIPLFEVKRRWFDRYIAYVDNLYYAVVLKATALTETHIEYAGTNAAIAKSQYQHNNLTAQTAPVKFSYPIEFVTLQSPNGNFTVRDIRTTVQDAEDELNYPADRHFFWSGFRASILFPLETPPTYYIACDDYGFHEVFSVRPVPILLSSALSHGLLLMAHYHKQWVFVPLQPFNFHFQRFEAKIDYQKDQVVFESKDFILLQTSYYQQDNPNRGSGAFIVRNGRIEKIFPIFLNRYDYVGWSDYSRFPFPALRVPRNSVPTRPDLLSTLPPPVVEDGGEEKK